jgi:hypothetical protein
LAGAILLLGVLWLRTSRLEVGTGFGRLGDHHFYVYMASHDPFTFHVAPYSWRPLVPALAGAFPNPTVGFATTTILGLGLVALALFWCAAGLGFSVPLSIFGCLLFMGLSRATKFNVHDYWLTEPAAFAFAAGAIAALLYRRDWLFAVLLLAGVFAKETVILVAPLAYTVRARRAIDGRAALRALAMVLPAVVGLVVIRSLLPAANTDLAYVATLPAPIRGQTRADALQHIGFGELVRHTLEYRSRHLWTTIREAALSFGLIVPALAFVGLRQARMWALRVAPFVVLAFGQLLVARDTNRLVAFGFPVVILLALFGARRLLQSGRVRPWHLMFLGGALFLANLGDPDAWAVPPATELAIVLLTALLTLVGPGSAVVWTPTRSRAAGSTSFPDESMANASNQEER